MKKATAESKALVMAAILAVMSLQTLRAEATFVVHKTHPQMVLEADTIVVGDVFYQEQIRPQNGIPFVRNLVKVIEPLKRERKQLKKRVAALKKLVAELERQLEPLAKEQAKSARAPEVSKAELKKARFSPKLIRSLRTRLGLSQKDFGALLGVTINAVGGWERGRSRPNAARQRAIVALRKLGKREVTRMLAELRTTAKRRKG